MRVIFEGLVESKPAFIHRLVHFEQFVAPLPISQKTTEVCSNTRMRGRSSSNGAKSGNSRTNLFGGHLRVYLQRPWWKNRNVRLRDAASY